MKKLVSVIAVTFLLAGMCFGHTWMTQWTSEGWTTCLGGDLSIGHIPQGSVCGDVFRLDAQSREEPSEYRKALRAEWFAEVLGEENADGMIPGSGGFWQSVAYHQKQEIVAKTEAPASVKSRPAAETTVKAEEKKVTVTKAGVVIPVGACVKTDTDADTVLFMRGPLGGLQMHLPRQGKTPAKTAFKCVVDIDQPGTYKLSASVVTIHSDVGMLLSVNGRDEHVAVDIPYTLGDWKDSEPIEVRLDAGTNTLTFSGKAKSNGLTIRQFMLTPVAQALRKD